MRIKQDNIQEYFALGVCSLYTISIKSQEPSHGGPWLQCMLWEEGENQSGKGELTRGSKAHTASSGLVVGYFGGRLIGRKIWRPTGFQGTLDCSLLLK